MSESKELQANRLILKVVGVGGAGINAVNAMIDANVQGVEFVCVSVSRSRFAASRATTLLRIGSDPRGLITGGNPEIARRAVNQHQQAIADALMDADMVFLTAGIGSGSRQFWWWLRGFGDEVEVLEPADLRKEFAAIALNLAEMYGDQPAC